VNRLFKLAALTALGAGAATSACGPTRAPCTSTTCLGCCDGAGECRGGFENLACGARGSACATCGLGQNCTAGVCTQPSFGAGGGSSGGGSSGGGSSGGGSSGGGSADGGFAGGAGQRCDASNCGGCCDVQGQCLVGRANTSCGSNGGTCIACALGLTCNAFGPGGRCEGGPPVGGGGAGGGSGGGSGACSPQTCPSGCCTSTGACQSPATTARCGTGGAACVACPGRETCVAGACRPCSGCVDLATGRCEPGTTTASCGKLGDFCENCSFSNASCVNQVCTGNMSGCNAQNCPSGCCDPSSGVCVQPAQQTGSRCGQGSPGSLCAPCASGQCSTSAGACVGGSGGGGAGGGFPGLGDGGFPGLGDGGTQLCVTGSQCAVGECCFSLFTAGVCARIGNPNLLGGTTCGRSQQSCAASTCQASQVCNPQLGVCQ
jgi:hypothetical protein